MSYDYDPLDDRNQFDEENGAERRRDGPAINLTGNTIRLLISGLVIGVAVLVVIILFGGGDGEEPTVGVATETPAAFVEETAVIPTFTLGPTATPPGTEPDATETPEAAEAPVDTVAVGATVEVYNTDGEGLNMRGGPGLNFAAVELLPEETQLEVIDGPEEVDDFTWWQVRKTSDGTEGWVAAQFIRPVDQ